MSVTHIAGAEITIESKYFRQRCSWCGEVLVEYDLTRTYVPEGDQDRVASGFKVGGLVRKDVGFAVVLKDKELPDDACALMPEWRP